MNISTQIQVMIAQKTGVVPEGPLNWDAQDVRETLPMLDPVDWGKLLRHLANPDTLRELHQECASQGGVTNTWIRLLANEALPYDEVSEDIKNILETGHIGQAPLVHRFVREAPLNDLGKHIQHISPQRMLDTLRAWKTHPPLTEWRQDLSDPDVATVLEELYFHNAVLPTGWGNGRHAAPDTRNKMIQLTQRIVEDGAAHRQRKFLNAVALAFPWSEREPTDIDRGPAPVKNPSLIEVWSMYSPLSLDDVKALEDPADLTFQVEATGHTLDAMYKSELPEGAYFIPLDNQGEDEHLELVSAWLRYPGSAWNEDPDQYKLRRIFSAFALAHRAQKNGAFPQGMYRTVTDYAIELWDAGDYFKGGRIDRKFLLEDEATGAQARLLAKNPFRPGFSRVALPDLDLADWAERLAKYPTLGSEYGEDVMNILNANELTVGTSHILQALLDNEDWREEVSGHILGYAARNLHPEWVQKMVDLAYRPGETWGNPDWDLVAEFGSDTTVKQFIDDGAEADISEQLRNPRVLKLLGEELGDNEQAWKLLLTLADDWDNTLIELVNAAKELADA